MTCDEVLPALELGDAARQQLARDHAQNCPACAAAVERWAALKSALTATPALTGRDRDLWRDARRGSPSRPRLPVAWLAVAGVAVVGVALLWPRPLPVPQSSQPAADVFADLDSRLDHLDGELAALENRIAVADARRAAAELTAEYRR